MRLEQLIIKSIFILLFLNSIFSSQTYLNNFGVSEIINTFSGYTKFTFIDYNNDSIDDLILFGDQTKSFVLHRGLSDSTFASPVKKFFLFPIDDFKWLTTNSKGINYYIFVSRNKRLAGIVSFTNKYSLQLLSKIEFDSYPSTIDIIDLNKDYKNKALIHGPNFNGIAILENSGYRLKATTRLEQNVFKEIAQVDFNQDGSDDLIAIDVMNNSLKFIENFSNNELVEGREIEFNEPLNSIKRIFYDSDEFVDLAVAKEGGLEILMGDSVFSYTSSIKLNYNFNPESFEIEDFNRNKFSDIALLNKVEGKVVLEFNQNNLFNSLSYDFDGISDIRYLRNKNTNGLILLSKNGLIKIINSKNSWGSSFCFSVGGNPNKIFYQKSDFKKEDRIIFGDQKVNTVSILTKNSKGKFDQFTKERFSNPISDFTWSSKFDLLVGYKLKTRLIEVRSLDKNAKLTLNQNYIYSSNPVEQLLIDSSNSLITLQKNKDKLFFQKFNADSAQYKPSKAILIDTSITTVMLNSSNEYYYWQINDFLSQLIYTKGENKLTLFSSFLSEKDHISSVIIDKKRKNMAATVLSIFHQNDKEEIIVFDGKKKMQMKIKSKLLSDTKIDSDNFWFYTNKNREQFLFVKKENSVQKYVLDFAKKTCRLLNNLKTERIQDYFVENFAGKLYLVYTTSDNCIKFKKI